MSHGIQHPEVVDLVAYLPKSNEVALVMIENRPWDGSQHRLLEIQSKVHNYVGFALDGQFKQTYSKYADKIICIELHCLQAPPEQVVEFLDEINDRLSEYEIKLRVVVVKTPDTADPIQLTALPKQASSWFSRLFHKRNKTSGR